MTTIESFAATTLRRDLASFADPATEIVLRRKASDGWHTVAWLQDGDEREARFLLPDDFSAIPEQVHFQGSSYTYKGFLAGPAMADLQALARNTTAVVPLVDPYVPLTGELSAAEDEHMIMNDADSLIVESAVPGDGRTQVVFLSAEAGVGKTSLLRSVVRTKAQQYIAGEQTTLWLYVDAQGQRLAQLDRAIAAELDNVRARFPYHAVVPLVRCGAVIVVVDGFDELIGSVGSYDEAFSSLAEFIASLNGYGCIVAAARSVYYEQEFLSRIGTVDGGSSDSWKLTAIHLQEWSPKSRRSYIRLAGQKQQLNADALREFVRSAETILDAPEVAEVGRKPLFVANTVSILVTGELPSGHSLLERLIAAHIEREVRTKLLSPIGEPRLTSAQYRIVLTEVAEELWLQEARELNRSSVRELIRILGEDFDLSDEALNEVVERLPYAALLASGTRSGSIAFEHDLFFSYFLSAPIAEAWMVADSRALGRILRRGKLPTEAADLAAQVVSNDDERELLETLSAAALRAERDSEQVRRNAGSLAAGLLRQKQYTGLLIQNLIFGDASWSGVVIADSAISACAFAGTDLSATVFRNCRGIDTTFDRIVVDPTQTKLDISGVALSDFRAVALRSRDSGISAIFSPLEVRDVLAKCSLPAAAETARLRNIRPEVLETIERMARPLSKANVVAETDSGDMARVSGSKDWPKIKAALLASGVLVEQNRSASGQKVFLRRRVRPEELMAGMVESVLVSDIVSNFWDVIENSFPGATDHDGERR